MWRLFEHGTVNSTTIHNIYGYLSLDTLKVAMVSIAASVETSHVLEIQRMGNLMSNCIRRTLTLSPKAVPCKVTGDWVIYKQIAAGPQGQDNVI